QFMNKVPFYGVNVVCGDDPGIRALLPGVKRPFMTYGFEAENRLRAVPISCRLRNLFEVWLDGEKLGDVNLPQPGRHNILNALGAVGAALEAGIPFQDCIRGLKAFAGVARRFEFKGERNGVTVVDDYGHHPAEIAATLAAVRQVFPGRRLVVAFQPHRFTRTQALFGEFCRAFDSVDLLLLTEIYPAGEKPVPGVSGQSLAQGIQQVSTTPVILFQTLDTLAHNLPTQLRAGDVLLTLGAGTITRLGPSFLESPDA
ncbi:MAG: UDP-N-acetylmuramate--L-alanine ligase, partial [Desulfovibrio sp.]|nr:UDP-N-acetylmuramate--L-alanine ligase [Desulfovibrio sp.]